MGKPGNYLETVDALHPMHFPYRLLALGSVTDGSFTTGSRDRLPGRSDDPATHPTGLGIRGVRLRQGSAAIAGGLRFDAAALPTLCTEELRGVEELAVARLHFTGRRPDGLAALAKN